MLSETQSSNELERATNFPECCDPFQHTLVLAICFGWRAAKDVLIKFGFFLQMFEGNMHFDTPEVRRFDPVPAQYIRVLPERWSPAGIGMRLEVLGCDWTGKTLANMEYTLTT